MKNSKLCASKIRFLTYDLFKYTANEETVRMAVETKSCTIENKILR